jgi:hypothetical protein
MTPTTFAAAAVFVILSTGPAVAPAGQGQARLKSIKISGPTLVKENSAADYTCTATYAGGTTEDVTSAATWTDNSWYAEFWGSGRLTTTAVVSHQACRISANYQKLQDDLDITIENSVRLVTKIEVRGPTWVKENSAAEYACFATYEDGTTEDVTLAAVWSEDSWFASFARNAYLETSSVTSNQWCRVEASFMGLTHRLDITIENSVTVVVRVRIDGPSEVDEESSASFTCQAEYDDGRTENVSYSADWSEDCWYASVSSSGRLETSAVPSDQWCRLTVAFGGRSDSHEVKIRDVRSAGLDRI